MIMERLIGRDLEIEEMERRYSKPGVRTLAIWGRRRVGKTFLIQEFCRDKPHLVLTAIEHSLPDSIRSFDETIDRYTGIPREKDSKNLCDILERLKDIGTDKERTVIVIDEYTFLCEEDPSCNSYLQVFIDRDLQNMNAFLIVCGSAIKMMERIFTDSEGALYRRFIGPMMIKPLSYRESRAFHPNMSESDRMRIYSIIGGIPLYHLMMNEDTVEECIKNNLLGPYAPLREEADYIVSRELDPVSTNLRILRAISDGHTSVKEITEVTGQSKENCYANLRNMETVGIVAPLNPMCGASRKEKIYRITDNLIRFHNEILMPNTALVSDADKDFAYDRLLSVIQSFYGPSFENICEQYLRDHHKCRDIGRWWGRTREGSTDIDLVALCDDGQNEYHLVCECKFRNKESGMREMTELESNSGYMQNCYNMRFCIFSRMGFTDDLKEYAESNGIELLTPENMYRDAS